MFYCIFCCRFCPHTKPLLHAHCRLNHPVSHTISSVSQIKYKSEIFFDSKFIFISFIETHPPLTLASVRGLIDLILHIISFSWEIRFEWYILFVIFLASNLIFIEKLAWFVIHF